MPSLYTAAGLLAGSAFIAVMMMANGTGGQSASDRTELSFTSSVPPVAAQFGESSNASADAVTPEENRKIRRGTNDNADRSVSEQTVEGGSGGQNVVVVDRSKTVWAERAVMQAPTSEVANVVINSLDADFDLEISTTLSDLPRVLTAAAEIPVMIDDRGVAFAKIESDKVKVEFNEQGIPLRTALRRMLRPLGLKAVVEDEGLVITAEPSALVHQGIGTSHWINIDEDAAGKIAAALDSETTFDFIELPLNEVVDSIAQQHKCPILVDRRALEEIGLSSEEPVTLAFEKIKLANALSYLLRELDLTYTVIGESLVVTTIEASEQNLATRIYWLEGTGFAVGDNTRDYQSVIDLIQSNIEPDTWEALGGPSTMAPITSLRPALMISTMYTVHENIDQLFRTLRESHFGKDPALERVQVPAPQGDSRVRGGGGFF